MFVCAFVRLCVCCWFICGWFFACLFVSPFLRLFVCLSLVCLFVRLFNCLFACLYVVLLACVFVRGCGAGGAHHGHPLGSLGHCLGTAWAPLATPWAPFGHPWTPPLLREPPRGRHRALPGRHLGPQVHPFGTLWTHLGGHFCHLGNVSPKRSKRPPLLGTCLTSFREGCTCKPTMPVQSKHTLGHYF